MWSVAPLSRIQEVFLPDDKNQNWLPARRVALDGEEVGGALFGANC